MFIALVIAIWPTTLGGSTSYVIVKGHSMEETLSPGDFVVLRTGEYKVGDSVSYKPFDDVPAQVIHRILEFKDDGTIVLQGDNNNFIDPFFPTRADITGKMLFHIPKIGSMAWFLGQPLVWGSLLLIAAAIYLYQPSRPRKKRVATPVENGELSDSSPVAEGAQPASGSERGRGRALNRKNELDGNSQPIEGADPVGED